jgi:hypothetical protein
MDTGPGSMRPWEARCVYRFSLIACREDARDLWFFHLPGAKADGGRRANNGGNSRDAEIAVKPAYQEQNDSFSLLKKRLNLGLDH